MKEKILMNVRIIDPSQKMDEIGNIVIDEKGKVKSIGKKSSASKSAEKIDLKKKEIKLRTNFFGEPKNKKKTFSSWVIDSFKSKKKFYLAKDVFFSPLSSLSILIFKLLDKFKFLIFIASRIIFLSEK